MHWMITSPAPSDSPSKPKMKPAVIPKPVVVDLADAILDRLEGVDVFLRRCQELRVRRFNPDENRAEMHVGHGVHQWFVVREIDGGLHEEVEGELVLLAPLFQDR